MVHSAQRLILAFTTVLVLSLPLAAHASVVYEFVLTSYTGSKPFTPGVTDIRLTLSDSAHASGVVTFNQTPPLTPSDPPPTVGDGVEQFAWWVGDRLPVDLAVLVFDTTLQVAPDNSLAGNIFFSGFEDTLRLTSSAKDGLWYGVANSDRPPVCSGDFGCTFAGYFVAVPEPGTLTILAATLVGLGLTLRRRTHKNSVSTPA